LSTPLFLFPSQVFLLGDFLSPQSRVYHVYSGDEGVPVAFALTLSPGMPTFSGRRPSPQDMVLSRSRRLFVTGCQVAAAIILVPLPLLMLSASQTSPWSGALLLGSPFFVTFRLPSIFHFRRSKTCFHPAFPQVFVFSSGVDFVSS